MSYATTVPIQTLTTAKSPKTPKPYFFHKNNSERRVQCEEWAPGPGEGLGDVAPVLQAGDVAHRTGGHRGHFNIIVFPISISASTSSLCACSTSFNY